MEKKKAEALYIRSEAETKKHKNFVDLIVSDINALEEKVVIMGHLSKTLKSMNHYFNKIYFFYHVFIFKECIVITKLLLKS